MSSIFTFYFQCLLKPKTARPLKIEFSNERIVEDIIRNKNGLRHSNDFYNVYINNDLSKEEREKERILRQQKRRSLYGDTPAAPQAGRGGTGGEGGGLGGLREEEGGLRGGVDSSRSLPRTGEEGRGTGEGNVPETERQVALTAVVTTPDTAEVVAAAAAAAVDLSGTFSTSPSRVLEQSLTTEATVVETKNGGVEIGFLHYNNGWRHGVEPQQENINNDMQSQETERVFDISGQQNENVNNQQGNSWGKEGSPRK